jgi:hypothetical protein
LKTLNPEVCRQERDKSLSRYFKDRATGATRFATSSSVDGLLLWNSYLSAYTGCSLTRTSDKLVAISAIAKVLKPIIESEYLAGLWTRYLPWQLLWQAISSGNSATPETEYCAPSWSWASVNEMVSPYELIENDDKKFMIQILEAKVETITSDVTGQVSGGYLKVRGWLNTFPLKTEDIGNVVCLIDSQAYGYKPPFHDTIQVYQDLEWWFLPILQFHFPTSIYQSGVKGLILVSTGENDHYRRIGIFEASDEDPRCDTFKRPVYCIDPGIG